MKPAPKIVCIIQARMGSSRLPGKVLMEICGRPMIGWVIERAARSQKIAEVVIATTTNQTDDPIEKFCKGADVTCFRGSEFDVLDRFYQAAIACQAEIVVRLTADCPLIDPQLVDETIEMLLDNHLDFSANRLPPPHHRTYPIGLDVEVSTFAALESAWKFAVKPYEREHVMPYIYDQQNQFAIRVLDAEKDYGAQRWTVDTAQDLTFIRELASLLSCKMDFAWREVIKIIDAHPELNAINADVQHKSYNDVDRRSNLK